MKNLPPEYPYLLAEPADPKYFNYWYHWKELKGQKSFQYYKNTEIKLGR